jgi:hypothetical protein
MNRYHRRRCRSPGWSAFMAGTDAAGAIRSHLPRNARAGHG